MEFIDRKTFKYCRELETIILPENLTSIEDATFLLCDKLKYINYLKL